MDARFIGGEDSDVYAMTRHVWRVKTALQNGDDLLSRELLAYPQGSAPVHLWASPLAIVPAALLALILPLAAAWNLSVIATMAGNGLAMYLLSRRMLGAEAHLPAFVAGAAYLAFPAIQAQLIDGQAGAITQWTLPLLLISLFDCAEQGGKRRILRAALFLALAALGSMSQVVYALMPLAALFLLARVLRRDQLGAARVLAAALGGCLLLLLYAAPMLGDIGSLSKPPQSATLRYSADLLDIATAPGIANGAQSDQAQTGAGWAYIGALGGLLALTGVLWRRESRWWLLLAFVAWLLALGPVLQAAQQTVTFSIAGYETVAPLPYAALMGLPVVELAWQPARFLLLYALAVSVMAGFGAAALWSSRLLSQRRPWLRTLLAGFMALAVSADYRLHDEFPSLPANIPQAIHDVAARQDVRAVFNAPFDDARAVKLALYLQTAHGKPLFTGRDLRDPALDAARLELLSSFEPSLLWEAGADMVVVQRQSGFHPRQIDDIRNRARDQLGEPIYEDDRFSVYETPFSRRTPLVLHASRADEDAHVIYIYKAQPGWLEFNATLVAVNRRAILSLNGVQLDSVLVNGTIPLSLPLPIARRGYHSFRLDLDPPCPASPNMALLQCPGVSVELDGPLQVLSAGAIYDPLRLEDGIVLAGYYLPRQAWAGWRFAFGGASNPRAMSLMCALCICWTAPGGLSPIGRMTNRWASYRRAIN